MIASMLQFFEVTAYPEQEFVFISHNAIISLLRMIYDLQLVPIDECGLPPKQILIFAIMLLAEIKSDKGRFRNRNHVIETKQTKGTAIQFHNVVAWLYVLMVFFWRLHRNKVFVRADIQDDPNIRPPCRLVPLDTIVAAVQEPDVLIRYPVYSQRLHNQSFPTKKTGQVLAHPAF